VHGDVPKDDHAKMCRDVDQPSAALVKDLKQRGLLDDTLVVWGGEFGRTVYSQGDPQQTNYGRDHHPRNFCMWMAGGGIKGGMVHGETDDFSYNIVKDPCTSTTSTPPSCIQLGIDHKRLTYRFQGRDFRLTDVHGSVCAASAPYTHGPASPDGIGKFYAGREISHVMGHEGAAWLERPEREAEEMPDKLVAALGLKPGDRVADIGAGTGYITRRLAPAVAPSGAVYAVEIQQEMLDALTNRLAGVGITNVIPILGAVDDPKLPAAALDLIVMVDVYHEFDHPHEMVRAMCRALKPGGRLVFVEYRLEDPAVPIKRLHKMSEEQVRREMALHPLRWLRTLPDLPRQHILVFEHAP
jgi:SAM-dependent methyltransferase